MTKVKTNERMNQYEITRQDYKARKAMIGTEDAQMAERFGLVQ